MLYYYWSFYSKIFIDCMLMNMMRMNKYGSISLAETFKKYIKLVPKNLLSIILNLRLLLSLCIKSSGWTRSLTISPFLNFLTNLPFIIPKILCSNSLSEITFAFKNAPLLKKFATSCDAGNDKYCRGYQIELIYF